VLSAAPTWLQLAADRIQASEDGNSLRDFFAEVARLSLFEIALRRGDLARRLGIGVRQFDRLLRAQGIEMEDGDSGGIMKEVTTPGGCAIGHLFEMIVTRDDPPRSLFTVRCPDGKIEVVPVIELDGVRYRPIPNDDDLGLVKQ
jgi:hypothetical protein